MTVGAAEEDLAGLARRHVAPVGLDEAELETGPGPAHGGGHGLGVVAGFGRAGRAALGEAVARP